MAGGLARALKAPELPPVVMVAGSEPLLVLEAADAVRARARALGFGEREVFDVEGGFDWNLLAQGLATMSLFSQRRLIELRLPTGRPGKEGAEAISGYCASPPPDTLLLIVAGDWSRKHEGAWSRAVDKAGVLDVCWPLKPGELGGWIRDRLASRGLAADPDAAKLLAERVEGNLLAAAQEIDKLALLLAPEGQGARVDLARMQSLVADSARFDVFALTEAAIAGDAGRAIHVLRGLRAEGEQVPGLLPWFGSQLALLAELAEIRAAGGDPASAMQRMGVWPARQAMYRKALSRGDAGWWGAQLAALAEVERLGKGRARGDAWLALERLVARVASPPQRVAALC